MNRFLGVVLANWPMESPTDEMIPHVADRMPHTTARGITAHRLAALGTKPHTSMSTAAATKVWRLPTRVAPTTPTVTLDDATPTAPLPKHAASRRPKPSPPMPRLIAPP